MRPRGFTFIELLVCLSIVATLAAILFPIIGRAKKKANEATSTSNLHQCGLALAVYMGGSDPHDLPPFDVAKELLNKAPTCDPGDYLRLNCLQDYGAPLIGSYSYVRGIRWEGTDYSRTDDWNRLLKDTPDPAILASPYYGDLRAVPYDDNDHNPCIFDYTCAMPSRVLRCRTDTSVYVAKFGPYTRKSYVHLFSWTEVHGLLL